MSPTQRTLAECRKRGWTVQVVEKWVAQARRRIDLFGVIDLVAIADGRIMGIQACAGSSHSARVAKILAEPRALEWLRAGAKLEVWSFSKRGARGKAKRWALRVDELTQERFAAAGSASAASEMQPDVYSSSIASDEMPNV